MTLLYLIASTLVVGLYVALNIAVVHLWFRFVAFVRRSLQPRATDASRRNY